MIREQQEYFEDFLETFSTNGWKRLMAELEEAKENLEKGGVYDANDEKDLYFIKGQLHKINQLRSLETVFRQSYEELENEGSE